MLKKLILLVVVVLTIYLPYTSSQNLLSYEVITNCQDNFQNCHKIVGNIYSFLPQGDLPSPMTLALPPDHPFDENISDCFNPYDVTIGIYNGYDWDPLPSTIFNEQLHRYIAQIDRLWYYSIIKTPACVPTECEFGSYGLDPSSNLTVSQELTFRICSIVPGCDTTTLECDPQCPQGADPECSTCTSSQGDCCSISLDGICDPDCAPYVDPDCTCEYSSLCCILSSQETPCNRWCSKYQNACSSTNSPNNGCNAEKDNVCDVDCPRKTRYENYSGEQGWIIIQDVPREELTIQVNGVYSSSIKLESIDNFKLNSGTVNFVNGESYNIGSLNNIKSITRSFDLKEVDSISLSIGKSYKTIATPTGTEEQEVISRIKVSLYGFTKIWSLDPDCCSYAQKTSGNCCPMLYKKQDKDDICDSDCIIRGTDPDC